MRVLLLLALLPAVLGDGAAFCAAFHNSTCSSCAGSFAGCAWSPCSRTCAPAAGLPANDSAAECAPIAEMANCKDEVYIQFPRPDTTFEYGSQSPQRIAWRNKEGPIPGALVTIVLLREESDWPDHVYHLVSVEAPDNELYPDYKVPEWVPSAGGYYFAIIKSGAPQNRTRGPLFSIRGAYPRRRSRDELTSGLNEDGVCLGMLPPHCKTVVDPDRPADCDSFRCEWADGGPLVPAVQLDPGVQWLQLSIYVREGAPFAQGRRGRVGDKQAQPQLWSSDVADGVKSQLSEGGVDMSFRNVANSTLFPGYISFDVYALYGQEPLRAAAPLALGLHVLPRELPPLPKPGETQFDFPDPYAERKRAEAAAAQRERAAAEEAAARADTGPIQRRARPLAPKLEPPPFLYFRSDRSVCDQTDLEQDGDPGDAGRVRTCLTFCAASAPALLPRRLAKDRMEREAALASLEAGPAPPLRGADAASPRARPPPPPLRSASRSTTSSSASLLRGGVVAAGTAGAEPASAASPGAAAAPPPPPTRGRPASLSQEAA
eukprot:tig00000411_g572.t1